MEYDWTGELTRKRKTIRYLILSGVCTAFAAAAIAANSGLFPKHEIPSLTSLNFGQNAEELIKIRE